MSHYYLNPTKLFHRFPHYLRLMRFDKPIGIFLLLWPTLWALWIATEGRPSLKALVIFILGVIIMRSAGCVVNDIVDRHIDKQVRRTQQRPLVTGEVNLAEAIGLFIFLCTLAFGLVLFLNQLSLKLSIVGVLLTIVYPFLKRVTHLPQLWLSFAFSWGIPIVFAAERGEVPSVAWFIFFAAIFWPMAYDTQYAMIDREDDLKIGVKSTAILFNRYDRLMIGLLYSAMLLLLLIVGMKLQFNYWFYLGLVVASGFVVYQQVLISDRSSQNCFIAFCNNNWIGLSIFLGIFLFYQWPSLSEVCKDLLMIFSSLNNS